MSLSLHFPSGVQLSLCGGGQHLLGAKHHSNFHLPLSSVRKCRWRQLGGETVGRGEEGRGGEGWGGVHVHEGRIPY